MVPELPLKLDKKKARYNTAVIIYREKREEDAVPYGRVAIIKAHVKPTQEYMLKMRRVSTF